MTISVHQYYYLNVSLKLKDMLYVEMTSRGSIWRHEWDHMIERPGSLHCPIHPERTICSVQLQFSSVHVSYFPLITSEPSSLPGQRSRNPWLHSRLTCASEPKLTCCSVFGMICNLCNLSHVMTSDRSSYLVNVNFIIIIISIDFKVMFWTPMGRFDFKK